MGKASRAKRAGREAWLPFAKFDGRDIAGEWWEEQWANNKYVVLVRSIPAMTTAGQGKHLSIHATDRTHLRDWREYQRIKNEICGEEWEGVELYPAESRLVDGANQYHLFCYPPPFKFAFGYTERSVIPKGSYLEKVLRKVAPETRGAVQR